jgi:hypothetical protein
VQPLSSRYQAQLNPPQVPGDAKKDKETNLHILAVAENARQLLKVLQPFKARITELEVENTALQMDSHNKEAMLQGLERKILRLQQDSQDRVTALEDEIADLQEQGQKDTDFLNEGIELARVSIDRKNAMLRQLEAELQGFKLESQEKDEIIIAVRLETKEKDETISVLRSEVSRLETASVKAGDELAWWKLENCSGQDLQKQPPKTSHSYQEVDTKYQSHTPEWQIKINKLIGRKSLPLNPCAVMLSKHAFEPRSSLLSTAVSLPLLSSKHPKTDTLFESKPVAAECFEEQVPIVKLPSISPCNAWTLAPPQPRAIPGNFVVRGVTSVPRTLSLQPTWNNDPVIKIKIPGQKASKFVSVSTKTCIEIPIGSPGEPMLPRKRPTWSEGRSLNEDLTKNLVTEKDVKAPKSFGNDSSTDRPLSTKPSGDWW